MEKKFQLGINLFSFILLEMKNIKIFNSNRGKIIEIIYKDKLLEEQNIYKQ